MAQTFKDFNEFWPYYLKAHSSPTTRNFHFAGTTAAVLTAVAGSFITQDLTFIAIGVTVGYALAWIGHFFFEKNKPATFGNPLWSFKGDMLMYKLWLSGRLGRELERCGVH